MEFQPGDQKNGIKAAGGFSGVPSMENESGESGSSGGLGSDTLMFTSMAVRPLSRCGARGIFAPAMRNAADDAAQRTPASCGSHSDISARTSSTLCQLSAFNHRQLAKTS